MRKRLCFLLAVIGLVVPASCQRPTSGPAPAIPTQPAAAKIDEPASDGHESENSKLIEETWDAYSIQGVRVGYAHTTIAEHDRSGAQS